MSTIQNRIKQIIKLKSTNIKELAGAIETPYTSFKNALDKNNNELNTKYCIGVSKIYGINLNWLLIGEGSMYLEKSGKEIQTTPAQLSTKSTIDNSAELKELKEENRNLTRELAKLEGKLEYKSEDLAELKAENKELVKEVAWIEPLKEQNIELKKEIKNLRDRLDKVLSELHARDQASPQSRGATA